MKRLGATAIWRINSYTNCWRKSTRIWPRRRANRVVFIVRGSCIVPTMIVNLAVVRDGRGAIAFVGMKKIAADGGLRSRCVSWASSKVTEGLGRLDQEGWIHEEKSGYLIEAAKR